MTQGLTEASEAMLAEIIALQIEFFSALGLHFRYVCGAGFGGLLCSPLCVSRPA